MDTIEQTEASSSACMELASPIHLQPEAPSGTRHTELCHRLIERQAAMYPDSVAASFLDRKLTYLELNDRANQLAHHLIRNGAGPGRSVAVCVAPSFDILICLLAIFKTGAAYVPLDPTYPAERLSVILGDVQPCLVLVQAALAPRLPPVQAPLFLLDRNSRQLQALCSDNLLEEPASDTPAVIFYTSGTTGTPKGVVLSYANVFHYVRVARERYEFGPHDSMPALARFTFSISLFELLCPLVSGSQVILLEREHVLDFKRLVPTIQQASVMHASPHLWRKLLHHLQSQGTSPHGFLNLRHVSSGGDTVAADLMESLKAFFRAADVFVIYGCSEIGCMGCTYPVPRDSTVSRNLVGKPFDGVLLRLLDENRHSVPQGLLGEVYFGGAGLALGYLGRAELTAERFVSIDGRRFYRTGDLGRLDAEGNLELVGRADFQVQVRGMRIELGEVESVLRRAAGVREAVAVARELENGEKALVAYIVVDASCGLRELLQFLRQTLPDYMVPSAFVVLDALPLNLNQKIDRLSLPAPTADNCLRLSTAIPPRNDMERKLALIWQSVLGLEALGVQDDFFDMGGNSLLSISLAVDIEKTFGVTLPVSSILTAPTIELQAALIESGRAIRAPWVLLKPGQSAPALFLIHDGDGEVLPYRNLALHLKTGHAVYGIQPYGSWRFPMLHTRLTDIVDHYLSEIRQLQPTGPYFLGGLCIGGFIAFEIARKLQASGEKIGMVALIDAAHVRASPVSVARRRLSRFFAMPPRQDRRTVGALRQSARFLRQAVGKIINVAAYETRTRLKACSTAGKLKLLRYCLDHQRRIPDFLQGIPVSTILRFAEQEYRLPDAPYAGSLLLLKATAKDARLDGTPVDDTPYADLFSEPALGWEHKALHLEVHEMPGGHSSMLQEPYVEAVARMVQSHIDKETMSALAH